MSTTKVPTLHRFLVQYESAPVPSAYNRDPDYEGADPDRARLELVAPGGGTTVYEYGVDSEVTKVAGKLGYFVAEIYLPGTPLGDYVYEWLPDAQNGAVVASDSGGTVTAI